MEEKNHASLVHVPFVFLLLLALSSVLGGCVVREAEPDLEEMRLQAARQLVQDYKADLPAGGGQSSPAALISLYSDQLGAQGPDKEVPEYIDGSDWFPAPGLLSITECEHCRTQSVSIISSDYGMRRDPKRRGMRFHDGIDIRAPQGSAVLAFKGGEVIRAGRFSTYGNVVEIRQYDGYVARYAHMYKVHVKRGQLVSSGEQVGEVGRTGRTTGSHLHFELLKDGESHDPQLFLTRVEQIMRCLKTGQSVK